MATIVMAKRQDKNFRKCDMLYRTRLNRILISMNICINPESYRDYLELCDIEKRNRLEDLSVKADNKQISATERVELATLSNFFQNEIISDVTPYQELEARYVARLSE